MLLKRLLTALALLTGLTAAGTPAQAQLVEVLSAQLESENRSGKAARAQEAQCQSGDENAAKLPRQGIKKQPRRTIRIVIPRVLFGADRAYE